MALLSFLRRDTAKDPFGGDDDDDFYDGESSLSEQGPKIALAASGLLFAVVVGFIAYALLTGENEAPAPAMMGSLADLEVVEEEPPAAEAAPVEDATAATDRSVDRRPWLTAQTEPPAEDTRLGVDETAKPAAPTAGAKPVPPAAAKPAISPPTTTAAVTPPPAGAAKPAAKPAAPTPDTQVAAKPDPPAAAEPAVTPAAPPPPADTPPEEIAGIPALNEPGVAPGAPERFATAGDSGPATAGGRPRLVDPPLPPTDRIAVSAPPPRFAALREVAKAAAPAANAPKIAVVIHGLGLSQAATEAAITKLPPTVTLAFSPYARNLKSWMDRAKAAGHEVLIEVPLESKDFPAQDPGPLGLLTTLELEENTKRLDAILKAASGATGVYDSMGTEFRESGASLTPFFAKLKEQNLFYVQGSPGVRVGEAAIPTAVADVVIDERPFRAAIDARLDYAERLARYQGNAVAAANAMPVSFERLVLWMDQAQKKGIALAPISEVLVR